MKYILNECLLCCVQYYINEQYRHKIPKLIKSTIIWYEFYEQHLKARDGIPATGQQQMKTDNSSTLMN